MGLMRDFSVGIMLVRQKNGKNQTCTVMRGVMMARR